jgi:hypothetical protein
MNGSEDTGLYHILSNNIDSVIYQLTFKRQFKDLNKEEILKMAN